MALSVSLADSELSVDPGGFVRTEVRIRNSSSRPERVRLRVTGPAARWSWVVPPEMDVGAGADVVMNLGFRVQRTAEPAAGELAFEVVAGPAIGHDTESGAREKATEPTVEARVSGVLTVTPFHNVAVELDPPDARLTIPTEHLLVVENRGNVPVSTALHASSEDGAMEVAVESEVVDAAPGQRIRVPISLRPGRRPLLQGRTLPFAVSAAPEGGQAITVSGAMDQPARLNGRSARMVAVAVAVAVLAVGLRLTVLAADDPSTSVAAGDDTGGTDDGSTGSSSGTLTGGPGEGGNCPAPDHRDTRATGLTPDDIPTLPQDFSFFQVAADGCSAVRWNPCEPVHYVINPANAPPTGVEDTREAFRRLAKATRMTYIDDGLTDEATQGNNRAFQPDRYPGRWAPILVHWMDSSRTQGDIQIVGGGFPTRVGDQYVTGNLFLNPTVVTNKETRAAVEGGFGDELTIGRIGPEGVTWGRIILHELGHITGLGHVSDPSQLMYPESSDHTGTTAFQRGDLAGMKYLGKDAGCLETPTPGPQTGRAGGFQGP